MSYQPFIHGPGRVGDYVKLNGNIYRIVHVEDFLSPLIGWNSSSNEWNIDVFDSLAGRGDTGFHDVGITDVAEARLLQITGIELNSPYIACSLKQPAKITRWGAGDVPEGQVNGFQSPLGSPLRLRNLFSVQAKPIQLRARNLLVAHEVVPKVTLRGFLYELEAGPKTVKVYYEPPIGGIE